MCSSCNCLSLDTNVKTYHPADIALAFENVIYTRAQRKIKCKYLFRKKKTIILRLLFAK